MIMEEVIEVNSDDDVEEEESAEEEAEEEEEEEEDAAEKELSKFTFPILLCAHSNSDW